MFEESIRIITLTSSVITSGWISTLFFIRKDLKNSFKFDNPLKLYLFKTTLKYRNCWKVWNKSNNQRSQETILLKRAKVLWPEINRSTPFPEGWRGRKRVLKGNSKHPLILDFLFPVLDIEMATLTGLGHLIKLKRVIFDGRMDLPFPTQVSLFN